MADAEIGFPLLFVEDPELTVALPFKPGVGQNIATHTSSTARDIFFVLISTFLVHSPSFFLNLLITFLTVSVLANAVSHVGLWNKICYPAHSHKRFKQVPW